MKCITLIIIFIFNQNQFFLNIFSSSIIVNLKERSQKILNHPHKQLIILEHFPLQLSFLLVLPKYLLYLIFSFNYIIIIIKVNYYQNENYTWWSRIFLFYFLFINNLNLILNYKQKLSHTKQKLLTSTLSPAFFFSLYSISSFYIFRFFSQNS